VVAHERAHLTALNHGAAFWQEVERLVPDFRAARDQIKRRARRNAALNIGAQN
jgi:predicted metal-dependent hydrolase